MDDELCIDTSRRRKQLAPGQTEAIVEGRRVKLYFIERRDWLLSPVALPILSVLGAFADQFQPELKALNSEIIIHPDWQQGMGTSIAAATNMLLRMKPVPQSVLILVCDQPALEAEILLALMAEAAGSGQGYRRLQRYAGVAGVPVVLSAKYFAGACRSFG